MCDVLVFVVSVCHVPRVLLKGLGNYVPLVCCVCVCVCVCVCARVCEVMRVTCWCAVCVSQLTYVNCQWCRVCV